MGKIYCTECGTELDDSVKFCSSCGTPVDDNTDTTTNSKEVEENKDISNNRIKEISKNSNNNKFSITTKIFLGVAAVGILCVLIVVGYIGFSMMTPVDNADVSEDTSNTLSPSFTDTIDGINFKIPEGYETFSGTDNQNKGTMTTYDRSYMGPDANVIEISVSTTQGSFYWDLSQNRDYDDVDKTINGHDGVLKSSGAFSYVTGDKLVVITGADEQQLESIIME